MRHNIILAIIAILALSNAEAQTTLSDYREEVIGYSHEMEIATLATEATEADMRQAKKGYLPTLAIGAEASLDFRDARPSRPWSWLADVTLSQTIYDGGGVRATTKRSEALHTKSIEDKTLALMDVIYVADQAYWRLSRAESHLMTIKEYVAVVDSLRIVVKHRYDEGYSAKGDLLQIESRISDARYQLSSAEQSYRIALHTYNSLRGAEIESSVILAESIFDIDDVPQRVSVDDIVEQHPSYLSMLQSVEVALWGIKSSRAKFLPTMNLSVYGTVQPNVPNIRGGGSMVHGGAILSLSTPIFHFGERREARNSAEAKYLQQIVFAEQVVDEIRLMEGDAWVNIYNARHRVDVTLESLAIAKENLAMSIYSYGEGMTTILDVLQAQLSWLQISQNAISAYYDYAMAIASYEYVAATTLQHISTPQ